MEQCIRPACRSVVRHLNRQSTLFAFTATQTRCKSTASAIGSGLRATRTLWDRGSDSTNGERGRGHRERPAYQSSRDIGRRDDGHGFGSRGTFDKSYSRDSRGSQQRDNRRGDWAEKRSYPSSRDRRRGDDGQALGRTNTFDRGHLQKRTEGIPYGTSRTGERRDGASSLPRLTPFMNASTSRFEERRSPQQRGEPRGDWTERADRTATRATSHSFTPSPQWNPSSQRPSDRSERQPRNQQRSPRDERGLPEDSKGRVDHSERSTTGRAMFEDRVPDSIPYTTASSQFIYGFNAVRAALKASRRELYKLHLADRDKPQEEQDGLIKSLAERSHVPIVEHANPRMLDRVSGSRAHNGIVLEASPLVIPPVTAIRVENVEGEPDTRALVPTYDFTHASELVRAHSPAVITLGRNPYRQPLVLLLDGVLDEGNMGNILRTAHFYGVDAVAVATNTCAPLSSPVVVKASSGACEAVRILALPRPAAFVFECAAAGFDVYASVAPPSSSNDDGSVPIVGGRPDLRRVLRIDELADPRLAPLQRRPALLMLGAEGAGLRENLTVKATHLVTIPRGGRDWQHHPDVGVDSLNVTVAAGVLLDAFVGSSRRRGGRPMSSTKEPEEGVADDGAKDNDTASSEAKDKDKLF